jgi:hypothetical protein
LGVGTNLKFYIENGGAYYDITPIRAEHTLTNPFATTNGSKTVTVTDASGGYITNDYVTFTGASAVGGLTISGNIKSRSPDPRHTPFKPLQRRHLPLPVEALFTLFIRSMSALHMPFL